LAILTELDKTFQVVEAQVELGIRLFEMAHRDLSFPDPVSGPQWAHGNPLLNSNLQAMRIEPTQSASEV
jgi:hypothetical protein